MAQEEREQDETPAERREGKRTATQMVVVGIIASLLGIAAGLLIDWFPPASSTQAGPIDTLWDVLIIASVPFFVLVTVVIGFSILNFRMRPGEEGLDGPPIHGNTQLEVIWTAVPAVIIVALVTYAYIVMRDIEEAPAASNERVVRVSASSSPGRSSTTRAAGASAPRSSTCRRASRCASTSAPRTSSTTSGCRTSA